MSLKSQRLYLGILDTFIPNWSRPEMPDRALRASLYENDVIGLFYTDKDAREWALKLQKHHRDHLPSDVETPSPIILSVEKEELHNYGVFLTKANLNQPYDVIAWTPLDFGLFRSSAVREVIGDRPTTDHQVRPYFSVSLRYPQRPNTATHTSKPVVFLTGTHGTGKTTLGKIVAEEWGVPFYPSRVSLIHEQWDAPASDEIDLSKRLAIQESVLKYWIMDYEEALYTGGVMDICPLDFVGYTLSSIKRSSMQGYDDHLVQQYTETCVELTRKALTHPTAVMICVPQFAGAEKDRGRLKAPGGAYADLVESIIYGMTLRHDLPHHLVTKDDLGDRLDILRDIIEQHRGTS